MGLNARFQKTKGLRRVVIERAKLLRYGRAGQVYEIYTGMKKL